MAATIEGMVKSKKFPKAGRRSDAPYCAFGDDSAFANVLVYSFVVVARERRAALEEEVLRVKADVGVPDRVPIHLNRFFNEHKRKKDGTENVDVPLLQSLEGDFRGSQPKAALHHNASALQELGKHLGQEKRLAEWLRGDDDRSALRPDRGGGQRVDQSER